MPFNPKIHNKKSIRLTGYDYTQEGLYFITICVQNRECVFGHIENGKMTLNQLGFIADNYWTEIPNHYPQIKLHDHIVMPNHLHGIIEIMVGSRHVGSRHGVTLHDVSQTDEDLPNHINQSSGSTNDLPTESYQRQFAKPISGSVSMIINQYKSSVKRWCNKNGYEYFQWQSRFHDNIIRSTVDYLKISNYIIKNPAHWHEDKFYE